MTKKPKDLKSKVIRLHISVCFIFLSTSTSSRSAECARRSAHGARFAVASQDREAYAIDDHISKPNLGATAENSQGSSPRAYLSNNQRNGQCISACYDWVLHIAKVAYFFSSSLPNVEWVILGPLPFFFYQKLFIFRFLENCF